MARKCGGQGTFVQNLKLIGKAVSHKTYFMQAVITHNSSSNTEQQNKERPSEQLAGTILPL